jgi:hypothetical protein
VYLEHFNDKLCCFGKPEDKGEQDKILTILGIGPNCELYEAKEVIANAKMKLTYSILKMYKIFQRKVSLLDTLKITQ